MASNLADNVISVCPVLKVFKVPREKIDALINFGISMFGKDKPQTIWPKIISVAVSG